MQSMWPNCIIWQIGMDIFYQSFSTNFQFLFEVLKCWKGIWATRQSLITCKFELLIFHLSSSWNSQKFWLNQISSLMRNSAVTWGYFKVSIGFGSKSIELVETWHERSNIYTSVWLNFSSFWALKYICIQCTFLKTCMLTSLIWPIYSPISMLKTGDQAFSPKMDFKRLKRPKFKRTKAPKWVLWQNLFAETINSNFFENAFTGRLEMRRMVLQRENAGKLEMLRKLLNSRPLNKVGNSLTWL